MSAQPNLFQLQDHESTENVGPRPSLPTAAESGPALPIDDKDVHILRVAVEDLRDALKQLSCVPASVSLWFFRGSKLHIRKCSPEICSEVVVPIISVSGQAEGVRFDVFDDTLFRLDNWRDEMCITMSGADELQQVQFSCPAAEADTESLKARSLGRPAKNSPSWRYQMDGPRLGVAVPAQVLLEAIRVTRGFLPGAFANYQAIQFSHDGTTGLAVAGNEATSSRFAAAGLGDVTWNIPREMVPRVNTFLSEATIVHVYADEVYTAIVKKNGAFLQWMTLKYSNQQVASRTSGPDQIVVRGTTSAIKETVRYLGNRLNVREEVVLGLSPGRAELVLECPGTGSGSLAVPIRVQPGSIDVDVTAKFTLGAIRRAFCGLKGKAIELRLSPQLKTDKGSESCALRVTEEYVVRPHFGRGCAGLPAECRATRVVASNCP